MHDETGVEVEIEAFRNSLDAPELKADAATPPAPPPQALVRPFC